MVNIVYCQKQSPESRCSVKKDVLKNFVNFIGKYLCCLESLFNKVAGLTPVLKNICQRLLLHYTRTAHCYLSVLLYIQPLLPHHNFYYCNISDVCFWFKWKKFQRIWYLTFIGVIFLFLGLSQFCFIFSCRCS